MKHPCEVCGKEAAHNAIMISIVHGKVINGKLIVPAKRIDVVSKIS